MDTVLAQLFTSHGEFSEYLHRFKLKEDPSCFCEPGVGQTVVHLVAHCPAFGRLRRIRIPNGQKDREKEYLGHHARRRRERMLPQLLQEGGDKSHRQLVSSWSACHGEQRPRLAERPRPLPRRSPPCRSRSPTPRTSTFCSQISQVRPVQLATKRQSLAQPYSADSCLHRWAAHLPHHRLCSPRPSRLLRCPRLPRSPRPPRSPRSQRNLLTPHHALNRSHGLRKQRRVRIQALGSCPRAGRSAARRAPARPAPPRTAPHRPAPPRDTDTPGTHTGHRTSTNICKLLLSRLGALRVLLISQVYADGYCFENHMTPDFSCH
ncbi:uncharacterized protein Kcmf1 isoform X2 [Battus philenor]|uniref:uncharacterized protein Kcmf1 isoform X2 n=1 Tax=Battus philenor TaxID=42288 RepID=UPI0035D05169